MKKILFSAISLFLVNGLQAQITATFESQPLPSTNYWKGIAPVPTVSGFSDNSLFFPNTYDTAYGGYWSGWGYSALSDSNSISYATNELAAFPAKGANNSSIYAVAYESYDPAFNCIKLTTPQYVASARIANSTIAYRSMQNGDGFAKIFGGATGNDPDFFKVSFTGWFNKTTTGSIDVYLADFRDTVNSNDYILKDWSTVNFLPLGFVDSITFHLSSSDTNSLGMKTPAYFCLDNVTMLPSSNNDIKTDDLVQVYPNPFSDFVCLLNPSSAKLNYQLFDIVGRLYAEGELSGYEKTTIATNQLSKGPYLLRVDKNNIAQTQAILHLEN